MGGRWTERTLSTPRPRNHHRPGGYLSCLLVYEIQHCYLAPHRGVLGAVRPVVVSGEFPTLKGRVPVRDYALTYPRFFLPPRSPLIKPRPDTREIRLNFALTTTADVKLSGFSGLRVELSFSYPSDESAPSPFPPSAPLPCIFDFGDYVV